MSEELDAVQRRYGSSVFWFNKGRTHRCGGAEVHPGTFLLWPICGQGDVPAGKGFASNGLQITCEPCIAALTPPEAKP